MTPLTFEERQTKYCSSDLKIYIVDNQHTNKALKRVVHFLYLGDTKREFILEGKIELPYTEFMGIVAMTNDLIMNYFVGRDE